MVPRPLRFAAFVLACAVIAWLSLAPSSVLPNVTLWDKIEHSIAYFGLTMIGAYAFPERLTRLTAGLFLGGVGVEIFQSLMAQGRQGDPADALANSAGIALALLVTRAIRELTRVRSAAGGE